MAGRPSALDRIIGRDDNNEPVTAETRILHDLRNGDYVETACANVGIHKDTYYGWRKTAALIRAKHDGLTPARGITAHERRCCTFSDAVDEATAGFQRDALERLGNAARGGLVKTKTVIKRGPPVAGTGDPGPVLETTTTTERLPPDPSVDEWRLERRLPRRWGRRIEIAGDEDHPLLFTVEERMDSVADQLEAFLESHDADERRERSSSS